MQKILNPDRQDWPEITSRPTKTFEEIENLVHKIFNEIKARGDSILLKYTRQFDKVNIQKIGISKEELDTSESKISNELKQAILLARSNIESFHESQQNNKKEITTTHGVVCWQESKAIEKVGLYIPGGSAPLFSTVLMLGIPAKIAGCKEIVICSPPDKNGEIDPAILYTANLIGINKVYKVGGIQAIGALTFGTESIPKVYKIFGPGNQYVTAAKQIASKINVAIDIPAGPSELLVVADESSVPAFVASDLLSQAEHGTDSQVICVVNHTELIGRIEEEVIIQLKTLPRKEIADIPIQNLKIILIEDLKDSINFINEYAPEHLILSVSNEEFYLNKIINAGSVFIGNYSPESAGDYASGTNHTLPTNGYAKMYSGVNLDSFVKKVTYQKITKTGLMNIGPAIEIMAEAEGLSGHKNAVSIRLKELRK